MVDYFTVLMYNKTKDGEPDENTNRAVKKGADEHILVCLSSSPSNARIIYTAAKMAKVLHAKFTAIYVQTDTTINDKDQSRLSQNIQLAQKLGAEIVMTHGEDVPLQISEYVRLSDVTKIVIGQSDCQTQRAVWETDSHRKADLLRPPMLTFTLFPTH